MADPLLQVSDLVCEYRVTRGIKTSILLAVNDVSLDVFEGEFLAIVGQSGSGKSTLGRCMVRLMEPVAGTIKYESRNVMALKGSQLADFRGDVQIVFQNPYQSLDPRLSVGAALDEVIGVWKKRRKSVELMSVGALLEMVHLPTEYARKYPHELSGGQRQRVAISRAMAVGPRLLVADEPVSALDVSSAAQVLNLLLGFRRSSKLTVVFITHDIGLARKVADRIAVMHQGEIVELGTPHDVFERPSDEYTKRLIAAYKSVALS
jgi:ABC-type glutathione transport system ATPase component